MLRYEWHESWRLIGIITGFDLTTSKGRKMVNEIIHEQEPDIVAMEPVCGPWPLMQNLTGMNTVSEKTWETSSNG